MGKKLQIAKEWKKITFTNMQGIEERSLQELKNVLKYQKKIMEK